MTKKVVFFLFLSLKTVKVKNKCKNFAVLIVFSHNSIQHQKRKYNSYLPLNGKFHNLFFFPIKKLP